MAVVLDTSALIEIERSLPGGEPPEAVTDEDVLIPAVVWAEALIGVRLANSPVRAARRRAQLEAIRQHAEIAPFTAEIAEHYADVYTELSESGALIPQNDIAVAATARSVSWPLLIGSHDEIHSRRVRSLHLRVVSA